MTASDLKTFQRESWIFPEMAQQAGLRRVESLEGAELIGMGTKKDCSGIAFPYVWPGSSEVRCYRIRVDHPEIDPGTKKPKGKYLAAPGRANQLYFPPMVRPAELTDTARPIYFTEGEKKTLALACLSGTLRHNKEADFLPIGLSGVWNWRGTIGKKQNARGERVDEKGPISDLDLINFKKRPVTLVFDADVQTNPLLLHARRVFAEELGRRGAQVRMCEIPLSTGLKGIDDLLAGWGPTKVVDLIADSHPADVMADVKLLVAQIKETKNIELIATAAPIWGSLSKTQIYLAKIQLKNALGKDFLPKEFDAIVREQQELRRRKAQEREEEERPIYKGLEYEKTPRGILWWKYTPNGRVPVWLCNFNAEITAEVLRDDGEETEFALRITATIADKTKHCIVSINEFSEMVWVLQHLGSSANVYPTHKERLRSAIQMLSTVLEEQHLYTHTGWTVLNEKPAYLHYGGAITEDGLIEGLEVDLEKTLKHYSLPAPLTGHELVKGIRSSLNLLQVAPDRVTLPLYSAIWRSVLGPVSVSMFLSGQTGSFKTELAALAQQHFGPGFRNGDRPQMPGSWESTANSLEGMAHKLKDALVVIDDFCPKGSSGDIAKLHMTADRILRAQGNHSGRGRLKQNLELRSGKAPRGMILGTGEDVPRGHSLQARMLVLEVNKPEVKLPLLTECQKAAAAGEYAGVMSAFLQWVAPHIGTMEKQQQEQLLRLREWLAKSGNHARTPDNIASLAIGLYWFLRFARQVKALDESQAEIIWSRAWGAFFEIIDSQNKQQRSADPVKQFVDLLFSVLKSGRAHVALTDGNPPDEGAEAWGWQRRTSGFLAGGVPSIEWRPCGERIGWIDERESLLYLQPDAAFAAIQKLARDSNEHIPITLFTMKRRLHQQRLLAATDEARQTLTIRRVFNGKKFDVLQFSLDKLEDLDRHPDPEGGPDEMSGLTELSLADFENPTANKRLINNPVKPRSGGNVGNVGLSSIGVPRNMVAAKGDR